MGSVQIATDLAESITRLFDDAGASQIERLAALEIARAVVPLSAASMIAAAESDSPSAVPPRSPE